MTTLVYTGTVLSIIKSMPPNIGAIIPPLVTVSNNPRNCTEGQLTFVTGQTQYRKQSLAL